MVHSESVEMYLKSLAELGGGLEPVAIARLAERLRVTQVSANEMMKRLAERELIVHTPYKGVTLTETGRQHAHSVIRRQRLWECFLVDHLKLDWARAHELACDLEHATAPEVIGALADYLSHPAICPHGNPIPNPTGEMDAVAGVSLSTLAVGQTARIVAIHPEDAEVLEYLSRRGVLPDRVVTVMEAAPLRGPLTLQIGDAEVVLGLALAARVAVKLI